LPKRFAKVAFTVGMKYDCHFKDHHLKMIEQLETKLCYVCIEASASATRRTVSTANAFATVQVI